MPYEYRKLSPEERKEIVNYRRERGYPLHAPSHPFREAGVYLISAANFEHRAIMNSPKRRTEFETRLLNSIKEISEDIIAWVILPNHYHVLISVQSLDGISIALKHLHGATSREWNLEDDLTRKRRVWYKFADTYIRNDGHLHMAFNYIHYNPVKHGYVVDPYEWPWSSLSMYYDDKGRDWLQEHWKSYTPSNEFGKGWDDLLKTTKVVTTIRRNMPQSSLAKKMELVTGLHAAIINAPEKYLKELKHDFEISESLSGKYDWVQIFVKNKSEADALVPKAAKALKPESMLWISFPKGTSKIQTDLTRDKGWESVQKLDLKWVNLVSVNETWSAFAFRPYKEGEKKQSFQLGA